MKRLSQGVAITIIGAAVLLGALYLLPEKRSEVQVKGKEITIEKSNHEKTPVDTNNIEGLLLAESLCGMNSARRSFPAPKRESLDRLERGIYPAATVPLDSRASCNSALRNEWFMERNNGVY